MGCILCIGGLAREVRGGGEISFVSIVGAITSGLFNFLRTCVKVGLYSYARDMLLLVVLVLFKLSLRLLIMTHT